MGANLEGESLKVKILYAWDIDGVLNWGSPPGPVAPEILKNLKTQGHFIVGASGHVIEMQIKEFKERGIELDACPTKNPEALREVRESFKALRYILIGDAPIDKEVASKAGYEYMTPIQFLSWLEGKPLGLNLGSGGDNRIGYINVDNRRDAHPDLVYDLEKTPYPWASDSMWHIIWKDSLEHLFWKTVRPALRECFRILRRGGTMYIQCPDLESIARKVILDPNFRFGELYGFEAISFWVYGRGDAWGGIHRAGFTISALRRLLEEVGFAVIDIHNDGGSNLLCLARKP